MGYFEKTTNSVTGYESEKNFKLVKTVFRSCVDHPEAIELGKRYLVLMAEKNAMWEVLKRLGHKVEEFQQGPEA
jgi:hypothetical protein